MINNIKSPTKNRRKIVVPFDGEEQFVVPKKGGFGQADNEDYVMVVGKTTSRTPINSELSTTTTTTSVPAEGTTAPAPTPAPATTTTTTAPRTSVPTEGIIPVSTLTTTTTAPAPAPTTTATAPAPCIYNPNDLSTYGCKPSTVVASETPVVKVASTPIVGITPTFPNWASLDCATLKSSIDSLNQTMAVSRFTTDVVNLYNTQLAVAKDLLQKNCPNESPTTDVTAGGFGGGGGGGATPEEQPATEDTAVVESTDNTKMLLVLVGIGVGLYFLMK
jgi:hypothetical protein